MMPDHLWVYAFDRREGGSAFIRRLIQEEMKRQGVLADGGQPEA